MALVQDTAKLNSDIVIMCAYLPPDISTDSFNFAMNDIRAMWPKDCVCIIVGDFNLPDIDWLAEHPNFIGIKNIALLDMFTDLACNQFITSPTRGRNVLDLLFCNDPMLIKRLFHQINDSTVNRKYIQNKLNYR